MVAQYKRNCEENGGGYDEDQDELAPMPLARLLSGCRLDRRRGRGLRHQGWRLTRASRLLSKTGIVCTTALAGRLQWKKFALSATDVYSRFENVSPIGGVFKGIRSALASSRSSLLRARAHSRGRAIEGPTGAGTQADSGLHFNRMGYAHAVDDGLPEPG